MPEVVALELRTGGAARSRSCAASRSASACSTRCSRGSASASEPIAAAACGKPLAVSLDDDARAELDALEAARRLRVPRVVDGAQGRASRSTAARSSTSRRTTTCRSRTIRGWSRRRRRRSSDDGVGAGASRLDRGNHRRARRARARGRGLAARRRRAGVRVGLRGEHRRRRDARRRRRRRVLRRAEPREHHRRLPVVARARSSCSRIATSPRSSARCARRRGGAGSWSRRRCSRWTAIVADVAALRELCERARRGADARRSARGRRARARRPRDRGVARGRAGRAGRDVRQGARHVSARSSRRRRAIAELLWNRARSLVFSTALPPAVAAASVAAIEIVRGRRGRRARRDRWRRTRGVCVRACRALGGDARDRAAARRRRPRGDRARRTRCSAAGVFVQGIRPPTVPAGTARLRVSVSCWTL